MFMKDHRIEKYVNTSAGDWGIVNKKTFEVLIYFITPYIPLVFSFWFRSDYFKSHNEVVYNKADCLFLDIHDYIL